MIAWLRLFAEAIGWLMLGIIVIWPLDISWNKDGIYRFCYGDYGIVAINKLEQDRLIKTMRELGYRILDIGKFSFGLSLPRWMNKLLFKAKP